MTYSDDDVAALGAEARILTNHNDYRVRCFAYKIEDALSTLTTPKAWTPIGWNGPFRAGDGKEVWGDGLLVLDANGKCVCQAQSNREAFQIASALNTALAPAVSGWRSIDDDTPRDGTPILVWDGESCTTCFWCKCSQHWALVSDNCSEWCNVTHWMPLPPPPETGGR